MKLQIRIWITGQAFLCLIYLLRVFSSHHRRQQSQGIGFFLLVWIVFASLGLILVGLLGALGSIYCRPMQRCCLCFEVPFSLVSSSPENLFPTEENLFGRTVGWFSSLLHISNSSFFCCLSILFQTKTYSSTLLFFQHTVMLLSMRQASFRGWYPCLGEMYWTL